jgi:hypothetical protein
MVEITRRARRRGRHRSHTTEPSEPGSDSDVSTARPTPINRNTDTASVPIVEIVPDSLLHFVHIHLSSAAKSNTDLRRYLIIFFAFIAGALLLAGGVWAAIAVAGIHLWNALLLGIGGTFTHIAIARKRARKRE